MSVADTRPAPISAVIPTKNRPEHLRAMLLTLAAQSVQVAEIVVIDASADDRTLQLCNDGIAGLLSVIRYERAQVAGAAVQRNQAMHLVSQPFVLFTEDDVLLDSGCVKSLFRALSDDPHLGGANAFIENQHYRSPGMVSRILFATLNGRRLQSYAGLCIGPAMNLLPETRPDLPDVVRVEWLNLGCTLYRREVLPEPLFPSFFVGYSLMEDVALSLTVGKSWDLANVRSARIYHDSQPGEHKSDVKSMARMELVNRHYIMASILGRRRFTDYIRLTVLQLFHVANTVRSIKGLRSAPAVLLGKTLGLIDIMRGSRSQPRR